MLPVQLFTMRTAELLPSVLLIRDCNDFMAFLAYKMANNFLALYFIIILPIHRAVFIIIDNFMMRFPAMSTAVNMVSAS